MTGCRVHHEKGVKTHQPSGEAGVSLTLSPRTMLTMPGRKGEGRCPGEMPGVKSEDPEMWLSGFCNWQKAFLR